MGFPVVNGMRGIEFGNPGESREYLTNLILDGNKRATAGLYELEYQSEGEPVEHVGEKLAILDSNGKHVGTIQVTKAEVMRIADVPDEFALAEAEGDKNAKEFRDGHLAWWRKNGFDVSEETLVVTVYFDLIEDLR